MLIVGIAGGTGSGKTTVVNKIVNRFSPGMVIVLPQDSYYRDNSHLPLSERRKINFDHPSSVEFSLLIGHIKKIKKYICIEQPVYSFLTCTRLDKTIHIRPTDVVIVEGILILSNQALRKLMDIKVFIDTDPEDRLKRIISRDIHERGRSVQQVLDRYKKVLEPMHRQFVEPTKKYADVIISQGGNNQVAIDMLISLIENNLKLQGKIR